MLKRISALLAGIMLMGSFSGIAAFAAPVEATVFEDNFENYANAQELEEAYAVSEGQNGRVTLGAEGENQVINVALVPPDGTTMVTKYFDNTYSTGNIILNYSVKPGSGLTTMFYLIKDGDVQEFPRFETDGKMYLDWNETVVGDYTAGVWYDVAVAFNLDRKTYDISVKKQGSDEAAVTKTGVPTGLPGVNGLRMQVWTNSEEQTCFDNVSVKHAANTILPEEPQTITLPYQQDFENVEQNAMKMGVGVIGENGKIVAEENGNKVFAVSGTSAHAAPELQFDTPDITEGKFGIEADMKMTGTGCDSLVLVRYDDGVTQAVLFDIDDGIFADWRSAMFKNGAFAVERWYHVKINLDVDEGLMDAMITGADGEAYTVKDYRYDDRHRTIKSVNFQIWSDSGTTYVDNVKITRNPSPISAPQVFTLPVSETFDGYSDMDALAQKWAMNEVTKNLACLDGTDADKNLKLTLTKTEGTVMATYGFNEKLNDGFLKVTFDVIPSGTACTLIALYDANNQSCPMFFFSGGFVYGATAWDGDVGARMGSFKADECYTCEAIIDFEAGKMDLSYKKKDAADSTKARKSVVLASAWGERADIWRFLFQLWEATDGSSSLDNLKVEYADPAPILDANKVTFKKNGVVQSDNMKLNPLTDEIVIDFGTRTLHDTVRNGVAVKTADNTPIEMDYTFEGTTCIIKPIDGLNQNTQYVLTISKDIQNIIGAKAREDLTVNFETTSGNLCVTERTLAADETDITTLTALKNAAEPILSIDYENGTEQPQTMFVIINSYKDTQLLKCHVEKMEFAAEEKNGVKQVNVAGKYETDADEISVMIWDGLTAIRRFIGAIHLSDAVFQN